MGRLGRLPLKYIEELQSGESFTFQDKHWIVTTDFKHDGQRLCYDLSSGCPQWLKANDTVIISPIYSLDKNNNICPLKIYNNENI